MSITNSYFASKKRLDAQYQQIYAIRKDILSGGLPLSSTSQAIGTSSKFTHFSINEIPLTSNDLLSWLRILTLQNVVYDIDVNSDVLSVDEVIVRKLYFREVLKSLPQEELLLAFLTSGLAWAGIKITKGRPVIQFYDIFDVYWDTRAETIHDASFVAVRQRWNPDTDILPSAVKSLVNKNRDVVSATVIYTPDTIYYIDESANGKELGQEKNPLGFIPFEPLENLPYPRALPPAPWIVSALALQTQITKAELARHQILESLSPKVILPASLTLEDPQAPVWTVNADAVPQILEPQHSAAALTAINSTIQDLRQQLIRTLGVNPFAGGTSGQRINFASEVVAIQGESGVTSAYIANQLSEFLSRLAKKVFQVAAVYDTEPFTVVQDGLPVTFNTEDTPSLQEAFENDEPVEVLPVTKAGDLQKRNDAIQLLHVAGQIQDGELAREALRRLVRTFDVSLPEAPPPAPQAAAPEAQSPQGAQSPEEALASQGIPPELIQNWGG